VAVCSSEGGGLVGREGILTDDRTRRPPLIGRGARLVGLGGVIRRRDISGRLGDGLEPSADADEQPQSALDGLESGRLVRLENLPRRLCSEDARIEEDLSDIVKDQR
jgi:hypothetical protein